MNDDERYWDYADQRRARGQMNDWGCDKGHGRLDQGCPWCEIERLEEDNDRLRSAMGPLATMGESLAGIVLQSQQQVGLLIVEVQRLRTALARALVDK